MTFMGKYPWEYIKSIPTDDVCITLLEAKKRRNDELLYTRWIIGHYDFEMSFDDFKSKLQPKQKKSAQSIIKDVDGYISQFNQGIRKVESLDGNI